MIPAVTHMDGASRIRVVDKELNLLYYSLIERFYQETGVPALLNTSFNLKIEPIVYSPKDVLNKFLKIGMDIFILDNFIIEK